MSLLVAVMLAAMAGGEPTVLNLGVASVTLPTGCHGDVRPGVDTLHGEIECAASDLKIHVEGGSMYPDVCESERGDTSASASTGSLRSADGSVVRFCSSRERSGSPEFVVQLDRGRVTFWVESMRPEAAAMLMDIIGSCRAKGRK